MSLAAARSEAAGRITELREHLSLIRRLESDDPKVPDSNDVQILRGLFYVHVYGLIEYTINQAVVEVIRFVNGSATPYQALIENFLSIALDPDFSALSAAGGKSRKWDRRFSFLDRQRSTDACTPSESVLGYDLQNIWCETLELVFQCFAISEPIVPEYRYRPFIDEIVNKRNAVAHGRETASRMGRGTRSPDLSMRLEAVIETCIYLLDRFDLYLTNLEFAKADARASIRGRLVT